MKSLGDFLYGKSHFKHCQNACPLVVTYLVEGSSFLLSFFHFLSSFQEGKTAKKRIPKKVVRHKSPPSCLMRQEGIPPTLSCYKLFAFNMKVNKGEFFPSHALHKISLPFIIMNRRNILCQTKNKKRKNIEEQSSS